MRRLSLLALVCLVGGCHVGPSVKGFGPARTPDGAKVELSLRHHPRLSGELLAVQDTALLVRVGVSTVTLVPFHRVTGGRAPGLNWESGDLTRRVRERLRLLSRFPYGLPPERLRDLLAAYGRDSVDVVH